MGGKGSPVVLLHGYAETGHMWLPLLPSLVERHTVIVPDLRGAGDSARPESGYDEKTMAVDIHELTRLAMPVLVLTGEKASGQFLIDQARLVATDVKGVVVAGSGHWLMEEAPGPVMPQLVAFLDGSR